MKYFFTSKIEKENDEVKINIPFNIWEVCKHRDEISAELIIDNQFIKCNLVPLEKGMYKLMIPAGTELNLDMNVNHKFLLHITDTLIRMDQNSPYSVDNPIRKIDSIDLIIQPGDGLCGQACIAMLAGVTIADVISVMDCREWQGTMGRLISALNYYGINHSNVIVYPGEGDNVVLPKCAILMEKMGRFSHYLLYFNGKFYDPNLGIMDEYEMNKLVGYLEIQI